MSYCFSNLFLLGFSYHFLKLLQLSGRLLVLFCVGRDLQLRLSIISVHLPWLDGFLLLQFLLSYGPFVFLLCRNMELIECYGCIIDFIVLLKAYSQALVAARTRFCDNTRLFFKLAGFFNYTLDCQSWRCPFISTTNKPTIVRLGLSLNAFAPYFLPSLFYPGRVRRIAIEILPIHIIFSILHYSILKISLLLLLLSQPHHEDLLFHP